MRRIKAKRFDPWSDGVKKKVRIAVLDTSVTKQILRANSTSSHHHLVKNAKEIAKFEAAPAAPVEFFAESCAVPVTAPFGVNSKSIT